MQISGLPRHLLGKTWRARELIPACGLKQWGHLCDTRACLIDAVQLWCV